MNIGKKMFHLLGRYYDFIYRVPVVGNWKVRSFCRFIGFMGYHSPVCPKHFGSIDEFIEFLKKMTSASGMDIEVTARDDSQFEFTLKECPYGFSRPDQAGVCEAAMDMDRTMFGHCGFDIVIKESLPRGGTVCREVFKLKR